MVGFGGGELFGPLGVGFDDGLGVIVGGSGGPGGGGPGGGGFPDGGGFCDGIGGPDGTGCGVIDVGRFVGSGFGVGRGVFDGELLGGGPTVGEIGGIALGGAVFVG